MPVGSDKIRELRIYMNAHSMDDESLFATARECAENAKSLANDASALANNQSYGRATALAILGQEEAGKAFALVGISFGMFPKKKEFVNQIGRHHTLKQLFHQLSALTSQLAHSLDLEGWVEHRAQIAEERHSSNPELSEDQIAAEALRFQDLVPDMKQYFDINEKKITESVDDIENRLKEQRKQKGFYVDFDSSGNVTSSPRFSSGSVAQNEIHALLQSCRFLRMYTSDWNYSIEDKEFIRRHVVHVIRDNWLE